MPPPFACIHSHAAAWLVRAGLTATLLLALMWMAPAHSSPPTVALPTPQSGLWIVKNEPKGSPGRSLAIDVQDGFLLSLIGDYDANGTPRFHVTAGALQADEAHPATTSTMHAALHQYRDGRRVGGKAQSAVFAGSIGDIRLRFSSSFEGTAQFPGEAPVAIERIRLDTRWQANPEVETVDAFTGHLYQVQGSEHLLRDSAFHLSLTREAVSGQMQLKFNVAHETMPEPLVCEADDDAQNAFALAERSAMTRALRWHCTGSDTEANTSAHLRIQVAGNEIVGQLEYTRTQGEQTQAATAQLRGVRHFYETNNTHTGESLYYAYSATDPQSLVPQSGIWAILDELNGEPGRGFAIDVDGNTLVLELFGYTEAGDATFYIGSTTFTPGSISQVPLQQPNGAAPNHLGMASLSFDSLTSGTIALPGEPARKIVRFPLSGPPDVRILSGLWRFNLPQGGAVAVQLDQARDGGIESEDGLFRCEFLNATNQQEAGNTFCTQRSALDPAAPVLHQFLFQWGMGMSDIYGQYIHPQTGARTGTGISRIAYPGRGDAASTYFSVGSAIQLPLRTAAP